MSVVAVSSSPTASGRRLSILRAVWMALVAGMLFLWVVGQPTLFHLLVTPCPTACAFIGFSTEQWRVLREAGITPVAYATVSMVFYTLSLLVWLAVGVLIFLRRGDHLGMLVISLAIAVTQLLVSAPPLGVLVFGSTLSPLVGISAGLGQALFYSIFYLFPNGKFVPRWTRWFFLLGVVDALPQAVLPPSAPINQGFGGATQGIVLGIVYFVAVGTQIYRYRRDATPRQRQQSKWAITGILLTVVGQGCFVVYSSVRQDALAYVVSQTFVPVVQTAIPVSIGIAILRSRLYDIDVIINRTLVYASLTALLAGVYFGSVLAMQHLAVVLVGSSAGDNPLILVLSTLLIAALFQPLRHRLQRTIDRRFYRQKYDAAKALARFAATLRGEVDIADLEQHLVGVVEETMQPAHVSLWLRAPNEGTGATPVARRAIGKLGARQ